MQDDADLGDDVHARDLTDEIMLFVNDATGSTRRIYLTQETYAALVRFADKVWPSSKGNT